jgi:ribosomal-protein-alanine N-acetyltransferase
VVTISGVTRGAFASARVGYFVGQEWNGQGIASGAVGLCADWAFGEGRLHRLSAGTLLDNVASQRVLSRNGFHVVGISRRYLNIAGRWRDHVLFARTVEDDGSDLGPVDGVVRDLDRLLARG